MILATFPYVQDPWYYISYIQRNRSYISNAMIGHIICLTPPQTRRPPFGRIHPVIDAEILPQQIPTQTNKLRAMMIWGQILTIDTPFMMIHMPRRYFILQYSFLFFQVPPSKWSPSWEAKQGCRVPSPPQRFPHIHTDTQTKQLKDVFLFDS